MSQIVPRNIRKIAFLVNDDPRYLLQPSVASSLLFVHHSRYLMPCPSSGHHPSSDGLSTVWGASSRSAGNASSTESVERESIRRAYRRVSRLSEACRASCRCPVRCGPVRRSGSPAPGEFRGARPTCGYPAPPSGSWDRARRRQPSNDAAGARAARARTQPSILNVPVRSTLRMECSVRHNPGRDASWS